MDELESKDVKIAVGDDAEFEIIQHGGEHDEDGDENDDQLSIPFKVRSPPTSTSTESSYGTSVGTAPVSAADIGDIGDGLDGRGSMYSSTSAHPSQNFLDSMYSFAPFGNNEHVERLVSLLREEQQKSRSMLERIMQIVTDLTKEHSNNTDLRTQNQMLKSMVKQEQDKWDALGSELKTIKEQMTQAETKNVQYEAQLSEMTRQMEQLKRDREQICNDRAELCVHLRNAEDSRTATEMALKAAREELAARDSDLATKSEIINVLQEENGELVRLVESNRANYRRNLDALETQMAELHERGEFPEVRHRANASTINNSNASSNPSSNFNAPNTVHTGANVNGSAAGQAPAANNAVNRNEGYKKFLPSFTQKEVDTMMRYIGKIINYIGLIAIALCFLYAFFSTDDKDSTQYTQYQCLQTYEYLRDRCPGLRLK